MRMLLIDDNRPIFTEIRMSLEGIGYGVDSCKKVKEVPSFLSAVEYDCIIMDNMLTGADIFSTIRNMRNYSQAPLLILTARDSVAERVKGLDSGADDCLAKPFAKEELLARVRALLRRNGPERRSELKVADLVMDPASHEVTRSGKKIKLTGKEFAILEYMIRNKNRLLTRVQIVDHVWSYDFSCSSNIVDVYIRYIRSKIDEGFEQRLLVTKRGSGYMLKEPKPPMSSG